MNSLIIPNPAGRNSEKVKKARELTFPRPYCLAVRRARIGIIRRPINMAKLKTNGGLKNLPIKRLNKVVHWVVNEKTVPFGYPARK